MEGASGGAPREVPEKGKNLRRTATSFPKWSPTSVLSGPD